MGSALAVPMVWLAVMGQAVVSILSALPVSRTSKTQGLETSHSQGRCPPLEGSLTKNVTSTFGIAVSEK